MHRFCSWMRLVDVNIIVTFVYFDTILFILHPLNTDKNVLSKYYTAYDISLKNFTYRNFLFLDCFTEVDCFRLRSPSGGWGLKFFTLYIYAANIINSNFV